MTLESAILYWLLCGVVGGAIGAMKGRVGPGVLLGVFLGPLGILLSIGLKNQKEIDKKHTKKCPYCAERVQKDAKMCKHCGKNVEIFRCPRCKKGLYRPELPPGSEFQCPVCAYSQTMP